MGAPTSAMERLLQKRNSKIDLLMSKNPDAFPSALSSMSSSNATTPQQQQQKKKQSKATSCFVSNPSKTRISSTNPGNVLTKTPNKQGPLPRTVPNARTPSRTSTTRTTITVQPKDAGESLELPEWYLKLNPSNPEYQSKLNRKIETTLSRVKDAIKYCKQDPSSLHFDRLRDLLHILPFLDITKLEVRNRRMLHTDIGLPQIFSTARKDQITFPWDIEADAKEIYRRWYIQDFDTDILRGIIINTSQSDKNARNTDRIDRSYTGRKKANYVGQGSLVNGQWWPTQLCTIRDGAHGSTQGGIYGEVGKGVYSIVLSGGNHYRDEDNGWDIWYRGTDSRTGVPTDSTVRMRETVGKNQPVRVLRSHNLDKHNRFRPQRGFRYDGLYDVIEEKLVEASKAIYKFKLRRRVFQDPIRFQGVEKRPTIEEIEAYDKLRLLANSNIDDES